MSGNKIMKFFGWRMVFTGLTLEFTVVGFLFYSFPVFWPYLISELGMTESQLGMVSAFYFIPIAILAIIVGRALDKYSVKNFMMIGAVIYAVGLFSLSFINSYWSLLTIYLTILALGSVMMGNLAVSKLISNWFDKNAGKALGIAAIGISFSGVALPLIVDPLLDLVGWRNVYVIFASVVFFIILPLIFFVVIDDPKTVNQVKDGIKTDKEEEPLPQEITGKDLLSKKVFWMISLAFAFQFMSMMGVLAFLPVHASKMGLEETWYLLGLPVKQYVFAYSLAAFGGVLGKILFGYLMDIMKAAYPSMMAMFLQAIGIFGITYFNEPSIFLLSAFIFGLGFGAATPLMTACYLRTFGAHNLGKARGIASPIVSPLQPIGVLVTSILIGFQDTYFVAFNIMGCLALVAVILASQIHEPKKSDQYSTSY
ncbi:MAG: MFS transporter [Gammaproteobacteria bacterium]